MTHWFRHDELPELPRGEGRLERFVAVSIMVIGLLGAVAAFAEIQAVSREATDDRQAKIRLLHEGASAFELSRRRTVERSVAAARNDWIKAALAMVASASGEVRFYARADMAARLRVARALASDRPLTQEGKTLIAKRSYYEADQHAKAYEQKRDGRTFQVRRFVTVITDFAIALLLLGVVATAPRRWRGHFVIPPVVIALFALGWGVHIYRSGGTSLDEAAIKKYVAGHIAEDQGDAAAAMTEYRRAIPEYRRARRDFSAAIRLGGSYHDAYLERGFVLLSVGNLLPRGQAEPRYSTAAADFREATELDKSDFTAWNGLAVASWWQRKYSDALAAIDRAARLDPQDATVSFNRVEGLAVASSDNAEYKRQLVVFQNVLGKMRRDAVEATRFDLLDLKQSAEWDPRIKRAMKRVCRDLRRTAETVGVISRYNCGGLPAVQRSSTAWKS